ncbi:MAG: PHP domain-containing protein [Myxococcota bacterium]
MAALATVAGALGCNDGGSGARAYRATAPDQLIGGDVAMARVGDFILENEHLRFAILDRESSPAPGVFGGTLVDADLVRPQGEFRNGVGEDQLAEVIPVANLLWPRPGDGDVTIVSDGSDGGPAIVRVSADAGVFLEALSLLRGDLLANLFPGTRFALRIDTDYILEPGARWLKIKSTATRTDPDAPNPIGDAMPLPSLSEPVSVFQTILGSSDDNLAPGMLAGDFLFFGARNDIFAPGIGFDEEKPIFDALFQGKDTFTHPLAFDFMAASGGDVSYGYFNLGDPGGAPPKVLVPIITSSSTGFITGAKNCQADPSDDDTCDKFAAWSWERYFVVGEGDIASVADRVYEARGTPVGKIHGVVRGSQGNVVPNAHVYAMTDPDPSTAWADSYAVAEANYRASGVPGLVSQIDADVGMDPIEDGDFHATLPVGDYVIFAQDAGRIATGPMQKIHVEAGDSIELAPIVPAPGLIRVRVTDGQGRALEAKLSLVPILADGSRPEGDGLRRPWLGEGRLGNGVRYIVSSLPEERGSETEVPVAAGRYEVVASHGPEWSAPRKIVEVAEGQSVDIALALVHEVDTTGWIAGDFHLHQEASFDSGMKFEERIRRVVAEGIDLAVATDHDIVADLAPYVKKLGVQDRLKTGVSAEVSTLELGHFIAFPLAYDAKKIPDHGAPDWTCLDGPGLMKLLKKAIVDVKGGVRIMAHPRDGFIGHISQIGLDALGDTRSLSLLEAGNVLLARTTCDFDAMEIFNSKRFDLIRTPTNKEVITFNRCLGRIDDATDQAALDVACPELSPDGPLATCPADERFEECKMRHRRRMAYLSARDILERTPEEQVAIWNHVPSADDDALCRADATAGEVPAGVADLPCSYHPGTYDDWMHWLDQGLNITITGASDSHGSDREPGVPRTWVESKASTPQQIDVGETARGVTAHHALPSYGPFVTASVNGKGPGETATVSGATFGLKLNVQTASWFGVDRIEIYVSGLLEKVITLDGGPERVTDFDGIVDLPVPAADGFVSVIALGTREDLLMRPVNFDVFFGELQLPRVASLAFASIPAFALFFTPTPPVPDFFPVFPMAATNAILLDVDGDGKWAPAGPLPAFCERKCDPAAANADDACEDGERCLEDGVCGLAINGQCVTGAPGTEQRYLNFE